MKNQQRNPKQSKLSSIEQQRNYQLNQNQTADIYQSNSYSPIRPILNSNESNGINYFNAYQGDKITVQPKKSPEVLYNNEGKPVSTIEYIKSQKDIEHLDFINTLLRLKNASGNVEVRNTNANSNTQYIIAPAFPKEASTIALNNDDSKSYIKEILDICGECTSEFSPIKSHGLKRNDLIEITNRRKRMADMPSNDKRVIEELEIKNEKADIQLKEIKELTNLNVVANANANAFNEKQTDDKKLQVTNAKQTTSKPITNKSSNSNNENKADSKSFNNQKNIRQIEDMLRETKKIENILSNKEDQKSNINNYRQIKITSDENFQAKQTLFPQEVKENRKHRSVGKLLRSNNNDERNTFLKEDKLNQLRKEENEQAKQYKENQDSKTEINKGQKPFKSKSKHKTSLSINNNNNNNANIKADNDKDTPNTIIKADKESKSDMKKQLGELFSPNHNYYSNILSSSYNNEKQKEKTKDIPQGANNINININTKNTELSPQEIKIEETPIVKAEIDLFEDEGNSDTISKQSGFKVNESSAKSKIVQAIHSITEKQIEFDIDELLHPKYLFKNANSSIIQTNSNSNCNTKRINQTTKKVQQRNSQSISIIDKHLSEKSGSKDIHNFKPPNLTKINTTKVLPSYNKQKKKTTLDQRVLSTSPSKPVQSISKTPTSIETNGKKNNFSFEPRKGREMILGTSNDEGLIKFEPLNSQRNTHANNTQKNENKNRVSSNSNTFGGVSK